MKPSRPLKQPVKVGELLRQRLKELKRTTEELATAAQVPPVYIEDLIAGRRRPPLPGRTDVYQRMTSFLQLGRNDLAMCADAERAAAVPGRSRGPDREVVRLLLELCEPNTAKELERRRGQRGAEELVGYIQRLLEVTQGAVRRVLDDQIGLRLAAAQRASDYLALRLEVLEFLDVTPDTLTADDVVSFLLPRIESWDVDFDTGVLRVVLRSQEPKQRYRRAPSSRPSLSPSTKHK